MIKIIVDCSLTISLYWKKNFIPMKLSFRLLPKSFSFTKSLATAISRTVYSKKWNKLEWIENVNSNFEIVFRQFMNHPFSKFKNFSKLLIMTIKSCTVYTQFYYKFLSFIQFKKKVKTWIEIMGWLDIMQLEQKYGFYEYI